MSQAPEDPQISESPSSAPVQYWSMAMLLAAGGVAFVFWRAWICDDAFITFRHVANCLAGHGPVFNPGERVQGFTHPLWFLILLTGSLVLDTYPLAVVLGLISTAVVILLAAWFFRNRRYNGLCLLTVAAVLLSSRTFIEYQTSGLETCLTHLLVLWTFAWLLSFASSETAVDRAGLTLNLHGLGKWGTEGVGGQEPTERSPALDRLAGIGQGPAPALIVLACSVLMLTRPDYLVPCVPLLVLVIRLLWRHGRRRDWLLSLLAAVPLLAWYGFSTVYYGTPLPNTAYAKTGMPLGTTILHGLTYQRDYGAHEQVHGLIFPIVLIAQTVLAIRDIRAKRPGGGVRLCLVLAVWLQAAYVVLIGGDFMRGRFLTFRLVAIAVLAGDLVGYLSATRLGSARRPGQISPATAGRPAADLSKSARWWRTAFTLAMIAGLAWSFGQAASQLSRRRAVGPPGVYPALPIAFLAVTGLSSVVLAALLIKRRTLAPGRVAVCLVLAGSGLSVLFDFRPRTSKIPLDGIADEHAWYRGTWRESRFAPPGRYPVSMVNDWVRLGKSARQYADRHGPIAVSFDTIGLLGYHGGPGVQIVDQYGLTDPFIARLPAEPISRVGHLLHDIPNEYLGSRQVVSELTDWRRRLDEGDPSLAAEARALVPTDSWADGQLEQLWKDIQTVTRDPVLSVGRWRLIPGYAAGRR